ncbi:MAG: hypothetical protein QGG24_02205 [Vicinamibacterales bacterium]|nr:hypothetical protein [Acidobacteriota bacterium]MDP7294109.1 hypothetical protein [Vicinamibacterales bacterium]MDP7471286.1 hypothetical protein [Vicinamibacterales bacterium]MDP7671400.1 hypothetical protein [Vicinamibacterales bacterium]HJO39269.1 hypothetical protein [Vicinamibacterales bacterium]
MLIVLPWSAYWDRNAFVESVPVLLATLQNHFVRGGVSGVGVINLAAGFAELVALMAPAPPPSNISGRPPISVDG